MRKLAVAALSFSAAVFAANYILAPKYLPVIAVVFSVLGIALIFRREKWLRGIIISLLAIAVGLGWFYAHYCLTTVPAHKLDGDKLYITGKVLEYPQEYDDYCRVRIRVENAAIKRLEAVLYDSSKTVFNAEPGQTIALTGKVKAADTRFGKEYDYYNSKDIYLIINAASDVEMIDGGKSVSGLPVRINRYIGQMIGELFPEDTAAFMRSLMLGDKTELYNDKPLHISMTRSGFMHTVAVSGMHIAFLVGLLQLLFGSTRRSSLLCIIMVWIFVLVTGCSHSAVRAGIMQTFLLLAPIVRRENDKLTSLSTALAIILLINPYAAAGVGLQLSFGAMAGIMCFAEKFYNAMTAALPENRLGRMLRSMLSVVSSSLAVMVFTLPLTAIHFGYIPLLSPVTNCLALWAVSLCFCGGYISCAVGALVPFLGRAAAWVTAWLARYIFAVCNMVSSVPFAVIYFNKALITVWFILCYALFGIWAISKGRKRRFFVPTALAVLTLISALGAVRLSYRYSGGIFSVLNVGQGQCVCVMSGNDTVMVDCGSIGTLDSAGETAGAYLSTCGRRNVDILILTHLHADHANGVATLLNKIHVGTIILPSMPEDEDGLLDEILQSADKNGTDIIFMTEDSDLELDNISASLFAPPDVGDENERCISALISIGEYDMLVTGDSPKSAEKALIDSHNISGVELLVAGHHGSRYSSCGELLGSIGADTAIISVGYNTYGHPTYETLERLNAYGYNILRTDLNGTIEIRIGKDYG